MNAFRGHALRPLHHRLGIGQFGADPVLSQDSPATLHRIVSAVVRRIVETADGLADVIGELDQPFDALRAPTIALQFVIALVLDVREASTRLRCLTLPPRIETVDDEIPGPRRASEGPMEGPTAFIDDTKRRVFFLARDADLSSESQGEDGIVIGVAADWSIQTWRFDHLGQLPQFCQGDFARGVRACEDHVKLRAGDDILQLGQDRGTAYQAKRARADMLEQDVRRAVPEQAREHYIGVNDYPQHAVGAPHVSP